MDETLPEFKPFEKIARLNRECVITEKIDGTNAQYPKMASLLPAAVHG